MVPAEQAAAPAEDAPKDTALGVAAPEVAAAAPGPTAEAPAAEEIRPNDAATPAPPADAVVHQYPSLAGFVEPAKAMELRDARLATREAVRAQVATIKAEQQVIKDMIVKEKLGGVSKATLKKHLRQHENAIKASRNTLAKLKAKNEGLKQDRIQLYLPSAAIFAEAQKMVEDRLRNQKSNFSGRWKDGALGMETKTYGPVALPLTTADTRNALNAEVKFETPYDAATHFLVMVLRAQLRGGKLAMTSNHKLLCKVLHVDCQFDRKVDDHREQRVRMASMRLVKSCGKTIASFFVGSTPENAYTYDEEDLKVAFDYRESGAAGYTNTDGQEFTAYAMTSGAMPMYPPARAIKLKFSDGGWRVYLFNSVATVILPPKFIEEPVAKYSQADLAYAPPEAAVLVHDFGGN